MDLIKDNYLKGIIKIKKCIKELKELNETEKASEMQTYLEEKQKEYNSKFLDSKFL